MSEEKYMEAAGKESKLPYIIAVDFDGTLVENKFPAIGEVRQQMWDAITKAKAEGKKVILYTSRTGEFLEDAVKFCASKGLYFDAVNDNINECKALGWNARKVFATIYVDDRSAVLSQNFGFKIVDLEVD